MGWNRAAAAQAIAATLTAAGEGSVAVFADPPASFNVPAYIVAWPTQVLYNTAGMSIDTATLPVLAAVATDQSAQLDTMLDTAQQALAADPTLGGLLAQGVVTVTEQRNWRILTDVAGARFLAAEILLEFRM